VTQAIHATKACDGGVVDDDSRALADHDRNDATGDKPRPFHVDVEHRVPLFFSELVGKAVRADAGIVEQDVDAPSPEVEARQSDFLRVMTV